MDQVPFNLDLLPKSTWGEEKEATVIDEATEKAMYHEAPLPILLSWFMVCKSDASQCIAVLSPSQSCSHGLWFASLMLHSALPFCHPPNLAVMVYGLQV